MTVVVFLFISGSVAADPVAGEAVYKAKQCSACHAVGGKGGKVGPSLDEVGSRHNKAWLTDQLKDPTSHKPDGAMPKPTLTDQELTNLVDYLLTLKSVLSQPIPTRNN